MTSLWSGNTMWGLWKSTPETEDAYRTVEHIASLRKISMTELVDLLIRDYARTPYCSECGSQSLDVIEGLDSEEDGPWPWTVVKCAKCGAKQ